MVNFYLSLPINGNSLRLRHISQLIYECVKHTVIPEFNYWNYLVCFSLSLQECRIFHLGLADTMKQQCMQIWCSGCLLTLNRTSIKSWVSTLIQKHSEYPWQVLVGFVFQLMFDLGCRFREYGWLTPNISGEMSLTKHSSYSLVALSLC